MAYPFTPCPPYEVFLEQLTAQGVEIKTTVVTVNDKPHQISYLTRKDDSGKAHYWSLRFSDSGEIVQFQVVRSVCKALKLDPALFGLHLG